MADRELSPLIMGLKLFFLAAYVLKADIAVNQPSSAKVGNMVASLEIGAFSEPLPMFSHLMFAHPLVTSLLAAHIADTRGRRMTLRAGALIFTIGGAFQTFCLGFTSMVVGRVISGFGVGMLSMVVPIYQVSLHLCIISDKASVS